jgi:hypothetical protein
MVKSWSNHGQLTVKSRSIVFGSGEPVPPHRPHLQPDQGRPNEVHRPNEGQMRIKRGSTEGQTRVKRGSNDGQMLVKRWSNVGRTKHEGQRWPYGGHCRHLLQRPPHRPHRMPVEKRKMFTLRVDSIGKSNRPETKKGRIKGRFDRATRLTKPPIRGRATRA